MPSLRSSSAAFQARPVCVRVVWNARDVSGDLQGAAARLLAIWLHRPLQIRATADEARGTERESDV